MNILELLLPKNFDRKLPAKQAARLDMLQQRMNAYVDKICDQNTSPRGREFLKAKLKDDYIEMKKHIIELEGISESEEPARKYVVYDRQTGKVVGEYSSARRARLARDKKDIQYGAVRYAVRPADEKPKVQEAIHKCPITDDDFKVLKEIMERPIPAAIAPIYIQDIIEDDELNDQLLSLEEDQPNRDVRPLIADWVNRVMPDQMYRFKEDEHDPNIARGILSPLHGYHQKDFKSQGGEAIMGDAYGQY